MAEDTITAVPRAPSKSYDAFISYSHAADDRFAPLLQKALQRFAKSWRQRRALEVFRDQTGLSVDPDLWHGIARALDSAEWFIYLASPDASRSEWVGKEINRWKEHKDRGRILVVLTDGVWAWDPVRVDFDLERSSAIHPELQGVFRSEPLVLDMRWAHQVERLTLRDARFRDCVATIAAPIHGRPKDDLEDEDTRNQRHVRRLSRAALILLATLFVAALVAGVLAVQQRNEARRQLLVAQARQLAATSGTLLDTNLDQAQLLAAQAYAMHTDEQTRGALYRAVTASPHLVRYYDAGSTITALRGSADGKVIVAGLDDGRVLAWNSGKAGEPRQVTRLDDAITEVAMTHDGSVIVASDGQELYRSDGGSTPDLPNGFVVDTFAISPTGKSLVVYQRAESGLGSRTLLVGADGTQTVPAAEASEYASWDELTFSGEDRVVFFDGGYGTWKSVALKPVPYVESEGALEFGVHNYASAMAANGGFVTYTNSSSEVPVWATRSEDELDGNELVGESIGRFPQAMALSADGGKLAVADGGTIYVSKTHARGTSGSPPVELTGNADISKDSLEFIGSGDQLVSATGSKVTLWDTRQLSRISTSYRARVPYGCGSCHGPRVGLDPDGRRLAVTSAAGDSELVVQTLGRRRPLLLGDGEYPLSWGPPVWRESGAELLVPVSGRDQIQVRDMHRNGKVITEWPLELGESQVVADGLSRDGRQLVLLGSAGEVQIRSARTGQVTSKLSVSVPKAEGFDAPLLVLDQDLNEVAVIKGKTVKLTGIGSHKERTLRLGALDEVAIAGDRLAAITSSRRLRVWDADNGKRIWSDSGAGGYLAGPFLSKHGSMVAAQRQDGVVIITDVDSGEEVARFQLPASAEGLKTTLVFDDSETKVYSVTESATGDDGQAQVWELNPTTWASRACESAGHRLTSDEVRQLTGVRGPEVEPCESSPRRD